MTSFEYLESKITIQNAHKNYICSYWVVQNLRMKICPKSFRPKQSFNKSVPTQNVAPVSSWNVR
jgi:hypothetical protein